MSFPVHFYKVFLSLTQHLTSALSLTLYPKCRASLVPLIHQLQGVNLLSPTRVGERWDLLHGLDLIISPVQPSSFSSLRGSLRQAPGSEAHGTLLPPSLHTPLPLTRRSWLQFYLIFASKQNSSRYVLKFLEGVEENTGKFSTHHV